MRQRALAWQITLSLIVFRPSAEIIFRHTEFTKSCWQKPCLRHTILAESQFYAACSSTAWQPRTPSPRSYYERQLFFPDLRCEQARFADSHGLLGAMLHAITPDLAVHPVQRLADLFELLCQSRQPAIPHRGFAQQQQPALCRLPQQSVVSPLQLVMVAVVELWLERPRPLLQAFQSSAQPLFQRSLLPLWQCCLKIRSAPQVRQQYA